MKPLAETTMSCSFPPEIFDLIIEYLYNDPTALKACCLVSRSWVPRTRKYLFADIRFHGGNSTIRSWMETFPDPSNSPAHHTRHLRIREPLPGKSAWIRSFHHVKKLLVSASDRGTGETSLVVLHGLSPTIRSFHLVHSSIPPSEIFNLICSFPLLEDLAIRCRKGKSNIDGWVAPLTSPKFTGTLHLIEDIHSTALLLLALPGGLHFTKIVIQLSVGDAGSMTDLVSRCSDTLESLCVDYISLRAFPSVLEVYRYLTAGG